MRTRRREQQSGQAIAIAAGMFLALTILGMLVFDAGLAMSDRRNLQAYADAAALAGARSYGPQGANQAHWVAMQYLSNSAGFSLPVGACSGPAACPPGSYVPPAFGITLSDSYRVGGTLNSPSVLDVTLSHQQPSLFARMIGFSVLNTAAAARASKPGPQI